MADRIEIYIEKSKQSTTAIIEFHDFPICGKHHRSVLLKDIQDLKAFMMPSSVKLLDIEAVFYIQNLDTLICYDTDVFDYLFNKITKESEDNTMLHKVTITKPEERMLEEYWLMRAIKENPKTKQKIVVKESECNKEPTLEEIALFLANSGGDFVSVEHNYRFADLPF